MSWSSWDRIGLASPTVRWTIAVAAVLLFAVTVALVFRREIQPSVGFLAMFGAGMTLGLVWKNDLAHHYYRVGNLVPVTSGHDTSRWKAISSPPSAAV